MHVQVGGALGGTVVADHESDPGIEAAIAASGLPGHDHGPRSMYFGGWAPPTAARTARSRPPGTPARRRRARHRLTPSPRTRSRVLVGPGSPALSAACPQCCGT
ncbi:hypothetical protein [Janibacter melonis]|uniref:hypothetical protein n=1 Tax=Janibacter melonis TaxID=262209 RepID=UPI00209551B2|nr:hypothetical protein [Janibacter melonis]